MNQSLPDPRRHAYRPELADVRLEGSVEAQRFVASTPAQVCRSAVPLRREPNPSLPFETEALFGEKVHVYDAQGGWAWIQLENDGYVGYVPQDALAPLAAPTHRVKAIGTFAYATPDMKSPPLMHLSLGASLTVVETVDRFYRLASNAFVVSRHVCALDWRDRDYVEVAERLLGTPYLWGGKTRIGLDCSALVQIALNACGIECPRDSDMQAAEVGKDVDIPPDLEGLQRGDLIFWKGHVGIMGDGVMLLHANAHHMAVAIEPLTTAANRIASGGSPILTIRRLGERSARA